MGAPPRNGDPAGSGLFPLLPPPLPDYRETMLERHAWGRLVRLLSWLGVVAALLLSSRTASAYPWMIRHEYQGCVPCHADPSGSGLLTEYGRAMGENVLRSRYGVKAPDEAPKYARFLFGVPTPDWLLLGGSVRNGIQFTKPSFGNDPTTGKPYAFTTKFLQMEADLRAQVTFGRFRASGALGYMREGAQTTWVTHHQDPASCGVIPTSTAPACVGNMVSREHWVGVDLGEDKQWLLRAGRINIPFGVRFDEHDLLVRSTQVTRTNINDSQQHGLAIAYSGQTVRGELMAILGNYQINPDAFRERGYAGFVEFSLKPWAAAGISSMVTYAGKDYQYGTAHTIRQAHGVFARLAPKEPLVLMAELDALVTTADGSTQPGMVGALQADVEPVQGLHFVATGETWIVGNFPTPTGPGTAHSYGGWAGVLWFFAPHADLRFDFVASSIADGPVTLFLLPQLHLYL